MAELRQCPRCEVSQPTSNFAVDVSKSSGRKSHCRACDNRKSRRWYAANREQRIATVQAYQRRRHTPGVGSDVDNTAHPTPTPPSSRRKDSEGATCDSM